MRSRLALLAIVALAPVSARAQMFGELVGGWNVVPTLPTGANYFSGSNVRASLGWRVASHFRWRIDAFTSQFDSQDNRPLPCPSFGCPPSAYRNSEHVDGLLANALLSVDPREIFYLLGGFGTYRVSQPDVAASASHYMISAGAGAAIPMGPRLRGVVEWRWHDLLGNPPGPSWLMPITVGLRC